MGRLWVTTLPLISLSLAISVAAPPVARASNSLVSVEVQRNGVAGVEGLAFASSVAVSSDGAHVYATGFLDNALVAFRRDAASGMLTFVGVQRDGVGGVDGLGRPHSLVVSPDGANVYVASGFDSTDADADQAVAVFRRDATTGALTFVEAKKQGEAGVDGLSGAAEVATSPDGLHVYVAAIRDGAVAVFARDGTTGALTFVEAKKQGLGGIDGLAGASSVVVAPDGGQVYVAGSASDAVVTFQRDASTGALSLFDVRRPEPLVAPVALAIAGNGEHLYAGDAHTNGAPGGIVVFEREEATGALHFDGWFVPAADWISGPSALRVSADGEYLYDADAADALVVSRRDVMEGDLAPVERQQNGTVGASSVALSPDDRHVYVAAHEGTIAVFRHRVVCSAAPQAACRRPIRSGKGSIHLANLPADDRNLIKWKWRAGAATSFAAFGNPTTTTDYAICVYDASNIAAAAQSALAPAGGICGVTLFGPCWKTDGTRGFRYNDKRETPDGIMQISLHAGDDGRARATVFGSYGSLPPVALPFALPVTVQLQASNGECWGTEYTTPRVNDGVNFIARD